MPSVTKQISTVRLDLQQTQDRIVLFSPIWITVARFETSYPSDTIPLPADLERTFRLLAFRTRYKIKMNRSRERNRSRGQQTLQMQSGFRMDGVQQNNPPSQYSWQPGIDGSLSYPNIYNHNQEPTGAMSTSNWNQEGPEPAPSYSELHEQSRANTAFFGYSQNRLQSTQQPHTGYFPRDRLSWDEHTQHGTTVSNTVEAQPGWTLPSRTNFARNPMVSADSGASPYLHPFPYNQPANVSNVQGRENDLETSRLPDPATAYRPTSNVGYPYDLSGLSPALVAQGSENLDNNFGPLMEEISGFQTNADQEPWSAYEPNQIPRSTQQDYASLETYPNGTPYTNPSTFENGNSESSYQTGDDSWTRISSNNPSDDVMTASRPNVSTQMHIPPYFRFRDATPPVGLQGHARDTIILETG